MISAKTHHHAVDFNIFEGMKVHGIPVYVISQGRVCLDNGQLTVKKGVGRYIPRPLHAPHAYERILQRERFCQPKKVEREPYTGPVIQL